MQTGKEELKEAIEKHAPHVKVKEYIRRGKPVFTVNLKLDMVDENEILNNMNYLKFFLRGIFDSSGYLRERKRKKGNKVEKQRNIRVVSKDGRKITFIANLLKRYSINAMVYRVSSSFCLDIEGATNLTAFRERIGFSLESKKRGLERLLTPVSLEEKTAHEVNVPP